MTKNIFFFGGGDSNAQSSVTIGAQFVAGATLLGSIQAFDQFGNEVTTGPNAFTAQIP